MTRLPWFFAWSDAAAACAVFSAFCAVVIAACALASVWSFCTESGPAAPAMATLALVDGRARLGLR